MKAKLDITGEKYNRLTAIRYIKSDETHRSYWEFKCDCGNVKIMNMSAVRAEEIKSCGCLNKESASERVRKKNPHGSLPPGEAALNALYRTYIRNAKLYNRVFELTIQQFREITSSNCYFCGTSPFSEKKNPKYNGSYFYNGIDRVDNTKGYILSNCVPSCTSCNYAKRDLTLDQFKELIKNIYKHLLIGETTNLIDFDSVYIKPLFSKIRSRKEVNVTTEFLGKHIALPLVNSNMDTISSPDLCKALADYGCASTLHRFWSIEKNVQAFNNSISNGIKPFVSIGITEGEFERAKALHNAGAEVFILDVAHAANVAVVEFYNKLIQTFPTVKFIVGDFGTSEEIKEFLNRVIRKPNAVKVGIGIGSVCKTRNVTGVGNTALSCLLDCAPICKENNMKLVLDGGICEIGDLSKAIVAGADLVVSGSMFSGCEEAAGDLISNESGKYKTYRGSASQESYVVQNKEAPWRTPEGTAILVPYKGPVLRILNNISGGLRSACSYVGAFTLAELKASGRFTYLK